MRGLEAARHQRWLIGLVVGAAAFTAVSATASSLQLSATTLQAFQVTVPHCDSSVTATPTSVDDLGVLVDTVELTDLNVACDGKPFKVTLVKTDGSMLGTEVAGTFSLSACTTACSASVSFADQSLDFTLAHHAVFDIHG